MRRAFVRVLKPWCELLPFFIVRKLAMKNGHRFYFDKDGITYQGVFARPDSFFYVPDKTLKIK